MVLDQSEKITSISQPKENAEYNLPCLAPFGLASRYVVVTLALVIPNSSPKYLFRFISNS